MKGPTGLDPFTVLGVEHRLDLDVRALERRYMQMSRECHPDLHRAAGAADCAAVLARSAEINDAWRTLSDRWERARALIDLGNLRQRLIVSCDDVFAEIVRACAEGDHVAAARRLHESRYVRKALSDLELKIAARNA